MSDSTDTRKAAPRNSCAGCAETWTGSSPCHCSGCHTTFSGLGLFDRHRSGYGDRGQCTPPDQLTDKNGVQVCEYRDGMWRYPEMTDEQKAARFGSAA